MRVDDRAIAFEVRRPGEEPQVELFVVRGVGRDAIFVTDEGVEQFCDVEELGVILDELRRALKPEDRDCPHCDSRGRWTDSNGIERRCAYCGGVGRLAA